VKLKLAHRRKLKQKVKQKNGSKSIDTVFNRLQTNIKNEKKAITVSNNNLKFWAFGIIAILSITAILALSNFNLVGQTNYSNDKGETLSLPPNMPSRYDTTLTQDPKLSNMYNYAASDAGATLLSQLVCYCGCNNINHAPFHENNKECFWTSSGEYEPHAETCSTCIYIALSAKTLYEYNWSVSDIRSYIHDQYT
jgi:hypothetical protein